MEQIVFVGGTGPSKDIMEMTCKIICDLSYTYVC